MGLGRIPLASLADNSAYSLPSLDLEREKDLCLFLVFWSFPPLRLSTVYPPYYNPQLITVEQPTVYLLKEDKSGIIVLSFLLVCLVSYFSQF